MKKSIIGLFAPALFILFLGCSQSHERMDNSESKSISSAKNDASEPKPALNMMAEQETQKEKSGNFVSSSAAVVDEKDTVRKFIRTADLRFNVKSVIRSTYNIEDITKKFKGFVTKTTLKSNIDNTTIIPVSKDSSLETVYYTVENSMELRVPAVKLDTAIKTISKLIEFLDFRIIQAEDVSLDIMAKRLEQTRLANYRERLGHAIDTRGKKLNETTNAEENLLNRQQQADNSKIESLALMDKIEYSTINVYIYQRQTLKRELIANDKNTEAYEPGFFIKLSEAFKFGWFLLQSFLIFIVRIWGLILVGIISFVLYRIYKSRPKKN